MKEYSSSLSTDRPSRRRMSRRLRQIDTSPSPNRPRMMQSPRTDPRLENSMWHQLETKTIELGGLKIKNRQYYMLLIYVGVIFIGSIYHTFFGRPRDTFFSDKHNFLNMYFVKWGWGWTSIPLLILMPLLAFHMTPAEKSPQIPIARAIIRWIGATMYWFVLTQWCFGHSVFDRVLHRTGTCTLGDDYTHSRSCRKDGGSWLGFDISGHCLLLLHSSLFIVEECRILLRHPEFWMRVGQSIKRLNEWRPRRTPRRHHELRVGSDVTGDPVESLVRAEREHERRRSIGDFFLSDRSVLMPSPDRDSFVFYLVEILLSSWLFALLCLWFIMLTATSTYFHTWEEKVVGTFLGLVYWFGVYVVFLPIHLPKWMPGQC